MLQCLLLFCLDEVVLVDGSSWPVVVVVFAMLSSSRVTLTHPKENNKSIGTDEVLCGVSHFKNVITKESKCELQDWNKAPGCCPTHLNGSKLQQWCPVVGWLKPHKKEHWRPWQGLLWRLIQCKSLLHWSNYKIAIFGVVGNIDIKRITINGGAGLLKHKCLLKPPSNLGCKAKEQETGNKFFLWWLNQHKCLRRLQSKERVGWLHNRIDWSNGADFAVVGSRARVSCKVDCNLEGLSYCIDS